MAGGLVNWYGCEISKLSIYSSASFVGNFKFAKDPFLEDTLNLCFSFFDILLALSDPIYCGKMVYGSTGTGTFFADLFLTFGLAILGISSVDLKILMSEILRGSIAS